MSHPSRSHSLRTAFLSAAAVALCGMLCGISTAQPPGHSHGPGDGHNHGPAPSSGGGHSHGTVTGGQVVTSYTVTYQQVVVWERCRRVVKCVPVYTPVYTPISGGTDSQTVDGGNKFHIKGTYTVTVKHLPKGAKKAQVWTWLPLDDDLQKVLDLKVVKGSHKSEVVSDSFGNRYLYTVIENPTTADAAIATEFELVHRESKPRLDSAKPVEMTEGHKTAFARYLDTEEANVVLTPQLKDLLNKKADPGSEKNAVQSIKNIFTYVAKNSELHTHPGGHHTHSHADMGVASRASGVDDTHWHYDPGLGSTNTCFTAGEKLGGGCMDQSSAVLAMFRARGIPTRVKFGSVIPEQHLVGKDLKPTENDPSFSLGYQAHIEYFVPGLGWMPADVHEAGHAFHDKREDLLTYHMSGLSERRITWFAGRNVKLLDDKGEPQTDQLGLFLHCYVLVDGKQHSPHKEGAAKTRENRIAAFTPTLKYSVVK